MRALSRGDSGEEDPDRVEAGARRSDAGGHLDEACRQTGNEVWIGWVSNQEGFLEDVFERC